MANITVVDGIAYCNLCGDIVVGSVCLCAESKLDEWRDTKRATRPD